MTLQEIEIRALRLSPAERESLAQKLIASLDSEPLTEVDEAWIAEAERRLEELKSGKSGVPADQAYREIRRDLGWES